MIAISETLEHSVDLLRLFRELDLHEQLSYGHVDGIAKEGKLAHVTS
jgi:hypothetical protein